MKASYEAAALGRQAGRQAGSNCGLTAAQPQKHSPFAKFLLFLLTTLLAFTFTACGSDDDSPNEARSSAPTGKPYKDIVNGIQGQFRSNQWGTNIVFSRKIEVYNANLTTDSEYPGRIRDYVKPGNKKSVAFYPAAYTENTMPYTATETSRWQSLTPMTRGEVTINSQQVTAIKADQFLTNFVVSPSDTGYILTITGGTSGTETKDYTHDDIANLYYVPSTDKFTLASGTDLKELSFPVKIEIKGAAAYTTPSTAQPPALPKLDSTAQERYDVTLPDAYKWQTTAADKTETAFETWFKSQESYSATTWSAVQTYDRSGSERSYSYATLLDPLVTEEALKAAVGATYSGLNKTQLVKLFGFTTESTQDSLIPEFGRRLSRGNYDILYSYDELYDKAYLTGIDSNVRICWDKTFLDTPEPNANSEN